MATYATWPLLVSCLLVVNVITGSTLTGLSVVAASDLIFKVNVIYEEDTSPFAPVVEFIP